jgi:hypothetical protein
MKSFFSANRVASLACASLLASCGPRSAACELASSWSLSEERVGGDCGLIEPVVGGLLEIEERSGVYAFRYHQPGRTAMSCSGVPEEDLCSVALTCAGDGSDERAGVTFRIELEEGRISGQRKVQLRDPSCGASYAIEGENR